MAILIATCPFMNVAVAQETQAKQSQGTTIVGKAIFRGDAKKHPQLSIDTGGHEFCSKIPDLKTESVILNTATTPTTIKNVVVYLTDVTPKVPDIMYDSVMIQMKDCRFQPHITAMHTKQQLNIRNADDCVHGVHMIPKINKEHNVLMQRVNMQMAFRIKPEPEPFWIQSDTEPWMGGWIACFDHPYFAVSGDDGSFRITDVPPGKYTLKAWHEIFGTLTQTVEIKGDEFKPVEFAFDEPKEEKKRGTTP
ncbi:MAG: hypothetical protein HY287_15870 [Planctomycetes bacterium]|nr:hypothetical protein [Planctomycetota bacterium]MBI3835804.1 hypothetical protein [Planctomycetota bacterium]